MNIFGIHFCQDEAYAILTGLAFAGPAILWVRRKVWAVRHWLADRRANQATNCSSRKDS